MYHVLYRYLPCSYLWTCTRSNKSVWWRMSWCLLGGNLEGELLGHTLLEELPGWVSMQLSTLYFPNFSMSFQLFYDGHHIGGSDCISQVIKDNENLFTGFWAEMTSENRYGGRWGSHLAGIYEFWRLMGSQRQRTCVMTVPSCSR